MDTAAIDAAKVRARDDLKTRGTDAPLSAIRGGIGDAFGTLNAVLDAAPAGQVTRRPREGEWSVQEVLDHLVETYRPGVDELRCLLAGQRPPGDPIPTSLQSKAPLLRPWRCLRRDLASLEADVADLLAATPDTFATAARVPIVMVINVKDGATVTPIEWIEELDWKAYAIVSFRLHTVDHLKQARAALAAASS